MKIDRILYTHTYQIGLSNWEKIGMEAEIEYGDDPQLCLTHLKDKVEAFHRQANPQLYKNNEAIVSSYGGGYTIDEVEGMRNMAESLKKPTIINREYERKSIEIENVTSLEELAQFKEYCGKNPDLMTAYTNKLRELTNKIKV